MSRRSADAAGPDTAPGPGLPVYHFPGRNGAELAWREMGAGRPLVLLHGLLGSGAQLAGSGPARALAAQGHRVILPDLRGHGDSARPHDPACYPTVCQVRTVGDSGRLLHTGEMIRLGTSADLPAAASVYRRASLSNAGDRDNLLAHPEYLILGPEGLAEGRTYVAKEDGSVAGFATWAGTGGTVELEDLFMDPAYRRRGIAAALVGRIAGVLRALGAERLEVTANPHALGFYHVVGFIECGIAGTDFGTAPRMVLVLS